MMILSYVAPVNILTPYYHLYAGFLPAGTLVVSLFGKTRRFNFSQSASSHPVLITSSVFALKKPDLKRTQPVR